LRKNNHKNVTIKRHNFTKPEREYVKGIVHNLSFQRLTDQEIVHWLHDEKEIDLERSTVSKIRNQVEIKAEKYIELKKSTYKFVAIYKERIDSLFSYQKKLHEIINVTNKPEVQLRAISELHRIEMSIFNLWKQLPDLQIDDRINSTDQNRDEFEYDNVGRNGLPRAISYDKEEDERQDRAVFFGWKQGDPPLDSRFRAMMEQKYGLEFELWDDPKWIQCPSCNR